MRASSILRARSKRRARVSSSCAGAPERRLPELARACGASLVTWNRDYGPYAKRRDRAVRLALERDEVEVREYQDRVVFEGDEIRTAKGAPYSVFTPLPAGGRTRAAESKPPRPPQSASTGLGSGAIPEARPVRSARRRSLAARSTTPSAPTTQP